MMKWWVNEIILQNFLLNLNGKIFRPVFAKSVCPKYFQNSQMVIIMLCNGDKICKKNCLSYFGIQIFPKILLSHPMTEDPNTQRPKTDQKHRGIASPQSSGTAMCWTCFRNNRLLKKSLLSFHQKKFVPSSFSNRSLYQTT